MPTGAATTRSWADVVRARPLVATVDDSPLPCSLAASAEGEASDVGGRGAAKVDTQAWEDLAQRVASAFASAADDEDTEEATVVDEAWGVENSAAPLTPAPHGAKLCPCQGEVLVMFGHYGWLATCSKIDHPAAARNGGRIYVHRRDVVDGACLSEGDRVHFYLYVDEQGLGAEELCLQRDFGQRQAPAGMNPGALEFVPLSSLMQAVSSAARHAPPLDVFILNDAYWSGDSDSDSESSSAECEVHQRGGLRRSARQRKTKSRAHSQGSESTGSPSDSERCALDGPPLGLGSGLSVLGDLPPGLFPPSFRPPPGLNLPPGLVM